jgi:hypothetical protein
MSPSEHEQWLMDITFRVLRFISQDLPDQAAQINSVANLLAEYGENLQIVHKRKRTKSYEVEITYSIGGSRSPSLAYIRVHDMLAKKRYYGEFLKLRFYEDIFFLVSTITKRGSTIILAPRTSTKAGIYNEWYKVPMLIELDSLPQEK